MKKDSPREEIPYRATTFLGMVFLRLSKLFNVLSIILSYAVERVEEKKGLSSQILIMLIVPVVFDFLVYGHLDIYKVLEYYLLVFAVWGLIIGLQQRNSKEGKDKQLRELITHTKNILN